MEKIYMTQNCFNNLVLELNTLQHDERPKIVELVSWAAGNGDRSENGDYIYGKKRLRQIDSRLHFLSKRLDEAQVIDPKGVSAKDIRFGATVTLLNEDDEKKIFCIVGEDEIFVEHGLISYKSPLATALFKKNIGDFVEVHTPKGITEYEILEIEYKDIPNFFDKVKN